MTDQQERKPKPEVLHTYMTLLTYKQVLRLSLSPRPSCQTALLLRDNGACLKESQWRDTSYANEDDSGWELSTVLSSLLCLLPTTRQGNQIILPHILTVICLLVTGSGWNTTKALQSGAHHLPLLTVPMEGCRATVLTFSLI